MKFIEMTPLSLINDEVIFPWKSFARKTVGKILKQNLLPSNSPQVFVHEPRIYRWIHDSRWFWLSERKFDNWSGFDRDLSNCLYIPIGWLVGRWSKFVLISINKSYNFLFNAAYTVVFIRLCRDDYFLCIFNEQLFQKIRKSSFAFSSRIFANCKVNHRVVKALDALAKFP